MALVWGTSVELKKMIEKLAVLKFPVRESTDSLIMIPLFIIGTVYSLVLTGTHIKMQLVCREEITLNKILMHLYSDDSCVNLYVGSHIECSLYHYNTHQPSQSSPHQNQNELPGSL